MELVGRPVAPFGGCDTEPEPVVPLLVGVAPLFGVIAPKLGLIARLFGPVTDLLGAVARLFGSIAFAFFLGSDSGIPVDAAKPLARRCRAKLRRREPAAVQRWRW